LEERDDIVNLECNILDGVAVFLKMLMYLFQLLGVFWGQGSGSSGRSLA